jgi:very-short-patch-repair endonuclease
MFCFKRSIASLQLAKFWSPRNTLKPWQVCISSDSRAKFYCDVCKDDFTAIVKAVGRQGSWCPRCKHKTEKKLLQWLQEHYGTKITSQGKYNWCRNSVSGRYFFYDYVLEDYKLIIELDGAQHFRQVSNWQSPKITLDRDVFKVKAALHNGYSVIRLLQEDVFFDRDNWSDNLSKAIRKYDTSCLITICNNGEYDTLRANI